MVLKLLLISTMMIKKTTKKILIMDEYGFSRVCSAILASNGYETDIAPLATDVLKKLANEPINLVVTSYPLCADFVESVGNREIPIIILSEGIDERLMGILGNFPNACCMIKPIDYDKFKNIVKRAVESSSLAEGGYSIV